MSNNIVLIGFMGSGKTTIGRELARLKQSVLLDSDSIIEVNCGMSVNEIFSKFGEARFRALEVNLCAFMRENVRNAIIATGGGMPMNYDLRELGSVFYLKAPIEALAGRITADKSRTRPLFRRFDLAAELYERRILHYEKQADYTLNALDSVDIVANRIYDIVRGF